MLKAGRVRLDESFVKDGSMKIDPEKQTVYLDGEPLQITGQLVVMLNKPSFPLAQG